jgi:hypothetical protein
MFYHHWTIVNDGTIILYDKDENKIHEDSIEGLLLEMGHIKEE